MKSALVEIAVKANNEVPRVQTLFTYLSGACIREYPILFRCRGLWRVKKLRRYWALGLL